LKQLAERRTDIFGVGDEETAIGKKIGEEDKKKDDKVYIYILTKYNLFPTVKLKYGLHYRATIIWFFN
jgi:hypothetical protein